MIGCNVLLREILRINLFVTARSCFESSEKIKMTHASVPRKTHFVDTVSREGAAKLDITVSIVQVSRKILNYGQTTYVKFLENTTRETTVLIEQGSSSLLLVRENNFSYEPDSTQKTVYAGVNFKACKLNQNVMLKYDMEVNENLLSRRGLNFLIISMAAKC